MESMDAGAHGPVQGQILCCTLYKQSWRDLPCLHGVSASAKEKEGEEMLGQVTKDWSPHGSPETA